MAAVWKLTFTTAHSAAAETALELFGATVWSTQKTRNKELFEVYFDSAPDIAMLDLPDDAAAKIETLPDIDWVAESQQGLSPVIVPPFHLHGSHDAPRDGGWLNIEMQAGMAFGSGHHGTTQGCLFLLADILKRHSPRSLADIGCGTGILAIAAAKAGCKNIWASDIDADAVGVARANMRLNRVAPQINCFAASGFQHRAYRGQRFDLIMANILAGPLRHLAVTFERHLTPAGRVIVSGLLTPQSRAVRARYLACGLRVEKKIVIGQWTSLCFRR